MKNELERETKWEVDQDYALPALDGLVADSRIETRSVQLSSVYFDTPDLDLLARNVTLRRREGDDESGWQLKIPQPAGRLEISLPVSRELPRDIAALVRGVALGKPLAERTRIDTLRDRHRIIDADGALIAEIADDTVEATPVDGSGETITWREVEAECGPATEVIPAAVVDALVEAGARPGRYPSKLSRVLPPRPARHELGSKAERVVHEYITTQIDLLFTGDIALRRHEDPIHDTRVASRRLRSTLRVFGKLLDPDAVGEVEAELKWYAGVLGAVRDCDVQNRRLDERIADLPPELVLGPVAAHIDADLRAERARRRAELAEAMDSPRYLDLLTVLDTWRTIPPFGPRIRGRDLLDRAHRAAKKADKRLATALRDERDESLHRARKAAKRARYAAELHRPARRSKTARRNIAYYKGLQRVLGDHNDQVVSARYLWRQATAAGTTVGENGFTYGLLYANARQEAREAVRAVRRKAAKRP